MTTILCTQCYEPILGEPIEAREASFCSERCELLDAAGSPMSPAPRVLVAIVDNRSSIDRKVTQSLIALGWGNRIPRVKAELGIAAIDLAWFTELPCVDDLRNMALEQAMRDGFTHVLFLDSDMIFPDDLFARILKYCARDIIVSGFYTQRHPPYGPIALRQGQLHESGRYFSYRHDTDYADVDGDGLREEEVIGMGCALIPLAVVRQLGPRPWFEYKTDAQGWKKVSEDVPFCEKVRAAGGRIYLDPSIECGHLFAEFATKAHERRYLEVLAHTQATLGAQLAVTVSPEAVP